jgi:hypothetical protein
LAETAKTTAMAITVTTTTTKVTTIALHRFATQTLNAGTARRKVISKKIATPAKEIKLRWLTPMANRTSRTIASTTLLLRRRSSYS